MCAAFTANALQIVPKLLHCNALQVPKLKALLCHWLKQNFILKFP